MRRLVLALVLAVCASFPAATTAADASAGAGRAPAGAKRLVTVRFALPANHGFRAEVQASGEGPVSATTLAVIGARRAVTYQLRYAVVEERAFEASFGRLGYISFRFHPVKRVPSDRPAMPGCPADAMKEGVFVGSAHFIGERSYATIDALRVKGTVRVEPGRKCEERPARGRAPAKRPRREKAALRAIDARARSTRFLLAVGSVDHRTHRHEAGFFATLVERSEGMVIGRIASAPTRRPGAFVFDHDAGTATIRPPAPFRGHASFARHGGPRHPGRWRGDLSVPLLGHDPIRLTGPAFRAILNHDIPDDE